MNIDKCISIIEKQEELLRFPHFNRKDAWKLGHLMASRVLQENLVLCVGIRLLSGMSLFLYASEGAAINNENWMARKWSSVREMEMSSLRNGLLFKKKNQTLEGRGLDAKNFALSGGGFPIHVKNTGVIGAVTASGLPHLEDHEFIVESLSRFLKIKDVPRVPLDAAV